MGTFTGQPIMVVPEPALMAKASAAGLCLRSSMANWESFITFNKVSLIIRATVFFWPRTVIFMEPQHPVRALFSRSRPLEHLVRYTNSLSHLRALTHGEA